MSPSFGIQRVAFVAGALGLCAGVLVHHHAAAEPSAGLTSMVVTASRLEQPLEEVSAQVEVLTREDLERTTAVFLTDALKKNASVDVIQYPGGLSGIGMRGFRPEFSGTNQRVLVLVDGLPAGVTNLGNLSQAGVERVEVVKGSASAVYGASAMGGVTNFITRASRGAPSGSVAVGAGSFDTWRLNANVGGELAAGFDFDLGVAENNQRDDYRIGRQRREFGDFIQGDGAKRPYTAFRTRSLFGRGGWQFDPDWRADLRFHGFFGRDIQSPGAESTGTASQGTRDTVAYRLDFGLGGRAGDHALHLVAFASREDDQRYQSADGQRLYLDTGRDTRFRGTQLRDTWDLTPLLTLTSGVDYEEITNDGRNYNAAGERIGPFSPDDRRRTVGVYSELTTRWLDDSLIVNAGARYDRVRNQVRETPMRPDLQPGSSSLSSVNPRAGAVYFPLDDRALRLHASIGRGFVTPLTRQVAGHTEETAGDQLIIGRSNPDLNPETSRSYDAGVGYAARFWSGDVTWFRVDVRDRIESVIVINTPQLRETSWVNASSATAEGLEATARGDVGRLWNAPEGVWTLSTTATYYLTRRQELPAGVEPLRNVARFKLNGALDYDGARFGGRLAVRQVRGMVDNDFSAGRIFTDGAGGRFTYPGLLSVDLHARWRIVDGHEAMLQVDNLLDRYHYEKNDYPAPGRAVHATYRFSF